MIEIAYLTGASYKGLPIPDGRVPELEEPTRAALFAAGAAHGLAFRLLRWDDPELCAFPAALIRSCWDYLDRAEAFLAALRRAEAAGVHLFNPARSVAWNLRKTYLAELAAAGVPGIETVWGEAVDAVFVARAFEALDAAELVLKPQIGAGSHRTIRLQRNAWSEADLRAAPAGAVMAQPFLPAIASAGELSLHHFGGRFSHAVRKTPARGDWLANLPAATIAPHAPSAAERELALAALACTPDPLLYARVDLAPGLDGGWRVIELEAIEPALHLAYAPSGAAALCLALREALGA